MKFNWIGLHVIFREYSGPVKHEFPFESSHFGCEVKGSLDRATLKAERQLRRLDQYVAPDS